METDFEYNKERYNLEIERRNYSNELSNERNRMSILLKGEMGNDIDDVLSGRKFVRFTLKEKIVNFFIKLFKAI